MMTMMMNKANAAKMLGALVVLATLSGCAANRYCTGRQPYDNARSIPPIVGTDALKIPTTTTALKVPDAKPGESLTYSYLTPDPKNPAKKNVECLDQPPPIPPITDTPK